MHGIRLGHRTGEPDVDPLSEPELVEGDLLGVAVAGLAEQGRLIGDGDARAVVLEDGRSGASTAIEPSTSAGSTETIVPRIEGSSFGTRGVHPAATMKSASPTASARAILLVRIVGPPRRDGVVPL